MPFCRQTYAKNYANGRVRGRKVSSTCSLCGKESVDYASKITRIYCSRECKREAMKTTIKVPCSFCSVPVEIQPARLKWSQVRGRGKVFCDKDCQRKGNSGSGHARWISERTKLSDRRHSARQEARYKDWRTSVFERDKHTCQKCGKVGGYLHAHHIKEWEHYPELRYEISNGMTLCRRPCHKEIHAARRANRKMSDAQVKEARVLREQGLTLRAIGLAFGVTESRISTICSGKKRTKQLP